MNATTRKPVRVPPQVAALARRARRQGWRIERKGSHIAWFPPGGGPPVFDTSSRARGRAYQNHLSRLKAAGLE